MVNPLGDFSFFRALQASIVAGTAMLIPLLAAGFEQRLALIISVGTAIASFGVDRSRYVANNKMVLKALEEMDRMDPVEKNVRGSVDQFVKAREDVKAKKVKGD